MKSLAMRVLPAFVIGAFSGHASAAAFQLLEQNGSGVGTAYAGSAAIAENASTIFYNPAGMTYLPQRQVSFGVAAVRPNFTFKDNGSSGLAAAGGDGGNAGNLGFIPNAYLSLALTDDLYLGLGIGAPFGLKTTYDEGWRGQFYSLKADVKTINVNPSVAYRVNDKVSIGFGLDWQRIDATLTNQRVLNASPLVTGQQSLTGDDSAWGWNAGVMFQLSPAMRVGVSYRSAIKYDLSGTVDIPGVTNFPVHADVKLPDTWTLSIAQTLSDRWVMVGDLSRTGWSSLSQLNVIRDANGQPAGTETFGYKNTWRAAFGGIYTVNDSWKTKFGIAYDRTPTQDSTRSPRVPDNDRWWLSIGAQWKPSKDAAIDFGYTYLYLKDPSVNLSDPTRGTLKGSYSDSGHVLGVQYTQGF